MVVLEYLGIAFVSAACLLVMSKVIMQKLLRRKTDYYSKTDYSKNENYTRNNNYSKEGK